MDRTAQIKADLEAYRASKQGTSSVPTVQKTGNIKADLEAYRASKQQPQQPLEKEPTFGGKVVRGILKTPASIATNLINAGQVIAGKTPTQPFSGKYLGEVNPIGVLGDGNGQIGGLKELKESFGAGLEMASYIPVARGVKTGIELAKLPFRQGIASAAKKLAIEGGVQGALGSSGRAMVENKNLGEIAVDTLVGGAAGLAIGGTIGGVTSGIARTVAKAPIQVIKQRIVDATSKALGVSGKRSATRALVQPEQYARGLSTIRKYADDFDPKLSDNIFDDTLKGLVSAKNKVFRSYDEIASQAGKEGITIDLEPLESALTKYTKGITTAPKRMRAERLLAELRTNFPNRKATPSQMQEYIQLLNEELGGVSGGAERGAVGVVSDFTKQAREAMDSQISKLGNEYQVFRDEYASLKAIEDSLVRQYQKAMRKKGGGLSEYADLIGNAEMLSGIISGNPALMAKSGVLKLGAKYINSLNDPETWLRKAFQGIDEVGDLFTPQSKVRTPQLMLPAPKSGAVQSQINTPINLGSRSQSTVDASEIANIASQRSSKTAQMNLATKIPKTTAIKTPKTIISKTLPRPKAKSIGTVDKSIPKELQSLADEAKKYKSADEFVKATPKTVKVWNKSKFSNDGAYADIAVTRKVDNVTLYQGGKAGDGRQFWTSDKKYASQFGEVKEKTGSFYKVDNGNRVTDVYVEAPTKSQLTDIWNKAAGRLPSKPIKLKK